MDEEIVLVNEIQLPHLIVKRFVETVHTYSPSCPTCHMVHNDIFMAAQIQAKIVCHMSNN